eukprot:1161342-Pelagomonas_calceolata.AAC.5
MPLLSSIAALMIAASAGYDACCRELLARGANVCVRNKVGTTGGNSTKQPVLPFPTHLLSVHLEANR